MKTELEITDRNRTTSRLKIGITVLMLAGIAVGSVVLAMAIPGIRQTLESKSWPTVPGKITGSRVAETATHDQDRRLTRQERRSRQYNAVVEYEFVVNGATHRGSRVTPVSSQIGDEGYAKATVEKYPTGASVTVSYKPDDPSICVLEPGNWGGIGLQLLFAGVFIFIPLLILKGIWSSPANVDQYGQSKEQRERFGLVFRERILEWEPGSLVHFHRDRTGFLAAIFGPLIAGPILGLFVGLLPAFLFFSGKGPMFITWFYLGASLLCAITLGIWLLVDGRVRDSRIDWNRGTFRHQLGWTVHEFPLDQISGLKFHLPKPPPLPQGSNTATEHRKTFAARLLIHVANRRFIVLVTEFVSSDWPSVRHKLNPVIQQLAEALKVPLQEDTAT